MNDIRSRIKEFQLDQSAISLALGAIVVVVIGILVFNYFIRLNRPSTPIPTPLLPETSSVTTQTNTHVVQAGETLGTIAQRYYGTQEIWSTLCDANRTILNNNCDVLPIGTSLAIPPPQVAGVTTASPPPSPSPSPVVQPVPPQMPATGIVPTPAPIAETYTIMRGDTLCGILTRFKGSCAQIDVFARCNNIRNPNLIHADNILKLNCQ